MTTYSILARICPGFAGAHSRKRSVHEGETVNEGQRRVSKRRGGRAEDAHPRLEFQKPWRKRRRLASSSSGIVTMTAHRSVQKSMAMSVTRFASDLSERSFTMHSHQDLGRRNPKSELNA